MKNKILNIEIRKDIEKLCIENNGYDTRELIELLSKKYNTPKQRICGNISTLTRIKTHRIEVEIPKKKSRIYYIE